MTHDFKLFPELTDTQMQIYYFDSPHKQITADFRAEVVKVIDGDTIKVKTDFRDFDFKVRMANIAAPELNESGGLESQKWLEAKIGGEEVDILINPRNRVGKWGRIIGDVVHGGMSINDLSLIEGQSIEFDQRASSIW